MAAMKHFSFVNLTEEGRITDAKSQKVVRSQAMRDYRRRQRLEQQAKAKHKDIAYKPVLSDLGTEASLTMMHTIRGYSALDQPKEIDLEVLGPDRSTVRKRTCQNEGEEDILDDCRINNGICSASAIQTPCFIQQSSGSNGNGPFECSTDGGVVVFQDESPSAAIQPIGAMDPFGSLPVPSTMHYSELMLHCRTYYFSLSQRAYVRFMIIETCSS